MLCESAISAYEKYSYYGESNQQRGALVNYDSLPGIIPKIIAPLFKVNLSSKWLKKMMEESSTYSKSRTQGQKEFSGDSEDKEERATEGIIYWAERILQPTYDVMDNQAKESLRNIIENSESLREMFVDKDLAVVDWSEWKEMPSLNSVNSESPEEGKVEEIISPDKVLPLMRDVGSIQMDDIELITGDPSNKLDPVSGRIEVGIHAAGVNSIRFEVGAYDRLNLIVDRKLLALIYLPLIILEHITWSIF